MRRLLIGFAVSCVCGTALADYGFEPVSSLVPDAVNVQALAIGDVSGDGRDDLIVLASSTHPLYQRNVLVYAQTAAGTLAEPVVLSHGDTGSGMGVGKLKLGDFDGDGAADILLSHDSGFKLLRNDGGLQFTVSRLVEVSDLLTEFDTMDADLDGNLDIVGKPLGFGIEVYFGDGQDGIREVELLHVQGNQLQLVDMNDDGSRDLVYMTGSVNQHAIVHLHNGTGFDSESSTTLLVPKRLVFPNQMVVADFIGDPRPDFAFSYGTPRGTEIAIVEQGQPPAERLRGLPLILDASYSGGTLLGSDVDSDGRADLLRGSGNDYIGLWLRHGAGFQPESLFTPGTLPFEPVLATGDLNGDGRQDVAVVGEGGGVAVLLGRDEPIEPDLGIYLGLSPTVVAVRVDNHSQFLESQSFELMLELDARRGSVIADGLPQGCSTFPSEAHDTVIRCWMTSLSAGGDRTLQFPLAFSAEPGPNHLIARGSLQLDQPDLRKDNNMARKRIVIPPPKGRRAR